MKPGIFIIGDNHLSSLELEIDLEKKGYKVIARTSRSKSVLKGIQMYQPGIIIMDVELDDVVESWETGLELRQNKLEIPILFLIDKSYEGSFEVSNSALLSKPVSAASIVECIDKLHRYRY